jgi:hypothetical protein
MGCGKSRHEPVNDVAKRAGLSETNTILTMDGIEKTYSIKKEIGYGKFTTLVKARHLPTG